jgi:hypothetical protein
LTAARRSHPTRDCFPPAGTGSKARRGGPSPGRDTEPGALFAGADGTGFAPGHSQSQKCARETSTLFICETGSDPHGLKIGTAARPACARSATVILLTHGVYRIGPGWGCRAKLNGSGVEDDPPNRRRSFPIARCVVASAPLRLQSKMRTIIVKLPSKANFSSGARQTQMHSLQVQIPSGTGERDHAG